MRFGVTVIYSLASVKFTAVESRFNGSRLSSMKREEAATHANGEARDEKCRCKWLASLWTPDVF